jgi:hypothetical protein
MSNFEIIMYNWLPAYATARPVKKLTNLPAYATAGKKLINGMSSIGNLGRFFETARIA